MKLNYKHRSSSRHASQALGHSLCPGRGEELAAILKEKSQHKMFPPGWHVLPEDTITLWQQRIGKKDITTNQITGNT
jgi:hypothetical protein